MGGWGPSGKNPPRTAGTAGLKGSHTQRGDVQGGVIGAVDGTFDRVASHATTERVDGRDLERALHVDRVFSLPDGEPAFEGSAAAEVVTERERTVIEDGAVTVTTEPATTARRTDVAGVPGEFVVVGSGRGTFAFDLVAADTGTAVDRAALDLDAFFDRKADATPWKAGFVDGGEGDLSGVLHGTDLRNGHDLTDLIESARLNQVGLEHEYRGRDVKMTASASGYAEVYRPDLDVGAVLQYLREELVPHVSAD